MRNEIVHAEFEYYLAHQDELVAQYNGKVIALHNHEVVGIFDTYEEAYFEVQKVHPLGTFLLQLCTPGRDSYTVRLPFLQIRPTTAEQRQMWHPV